MKRPEILAPCGTWDALEAAVKGGADAVYLGGTLFSARAFAGNFDKEEMLRAIDYCHLFDVRIYMALNTLLKEDEIRLIRDYMDPYYRAGLDAVIVQDFGVVKILKENFPDLALHASTQMSVSGSFGARFLKESGFSRVVPAREISLSEIKKISSEVDIELETFVHGAMCYAYSGKCLMSSFIGGRSGNRGRCAQPCRQCWHLAGKDVDTEKYVMCMKDMCTLDIVPELIEAGIDSFKIEGRMKKPEYVAQAAAAYREASEMYLDGSWDEDRIGTLTDQLKDIYNRGGFSGGYYHEQSGHDMLADERPGHTGLPVGEVVRVKPPKVYIRLNKDINAQDVLEIRGRKSVVELTSPRSASGGEVLQLNGKEFNKIRPGMGVFRMRNNALIDRIVKEVIAPEKTVTAQALVEARVGKPLTISIWKDDNSVSLEGSIITEAESRPCDEKVIVQKMMKTGGSGVTLEVSANCDSNAFVQMSELNSLRRQAVEAFREEVAGKYRREQ